MGDKTGIGWTDSTWNPATGCTKVSPGCKNCYAEHIMLKHKANFTYREHENRIDQPIKWKKPRRIFVNSMSDLFHESATTDFLSRVYQTMMTANQHIYQILTKRPHRMAEFAASIQTIPKHIWMGVSVESPYQLDRIDTLRTVNCTTRFVSFEPLIEQIGYVNLDNIDWCIIGGESGPHFRPMKYKWARHLIDICRDEKVPVFFKQWGGRYPGGDNRIDGVKYEEYPKPDYIQETLV